MSMASKPVRGALVRQVAHGRENAFLEVGRIRTRPEEILVVVRLEPQHLAVFERLEHRAREMTEVRHDTHAAPTGVREDVANRFGPVVRRGGDAHVEIADDELLPAGDGPHVGEERTGKSPGDGGPTGGVDGNSALPVQVEGRVHVVRVLVGDEDRGDRVERRPAQDEPPLGLLHREARVHEDARPVHAHHGAVSRGAGSEKTDLEAAHRAPVLPKPPPPRVVSPRLEASSNTACATGAITSCAIRSPRASVTGSLPRFTTRTPTSPR